MERHSLPSPGQPLPPYKQGLVALVCVAQSKFLLAFDEAPPVPQARVHQLVRVSSLYLTHCSNVPTGTDQVLSTFSDTLSVPPFAPRIDRIELLFDPHLPTCAHSQGISSQRLYLLHGC